jgi:hypothetical protein
MQASASGSGSSYHRVCDQHVHYKGASQTGKDFGGDSFLNSTNNSCSLTAIAVRSTCQMISAAERHLSTHNGAKNRQPTNLPFLRLLSIFSCNIILESLVSESAESGASIKSCEKSHRCFRELGNKALHHEELRHRCRSTAPSQGCLSPKQRSRPAAPVSWPFKVCLQSLTQAECVRAGNCSRASIIRWGKARKGRSARLYGEEVGRD